MKSQTEKRSNVRHYGALQGSNLAQIRDKEIIELNIPTGIPLVYQLDFDLKCVRHYYLADENMLKDAMSEVAKQGKVK